MDSVFLQVLQIVEAELQFMAVEPIVHIITEGIFNIIYKYCRIVIRKKYTITNNLYAHDYERLISSATCTVMY